MEYIIDFGEFTEVNNRFFDVDTKEERKSINETVKKFIDKYGKKESNKYEDPYKIKMDLCDRFENRLIDKLINLDKCDAGIEFALKTFMSNFKEELPYEDCTSENLTDYFDTILSAIDNMSIKQIDSLIKCVKDYNLEGLFTIFRGGEYNE